MVSVPLLAMVTHGEILFVLGVVGEFLFRERPHTELVPLLQACTSFGALHTHLQSHLDDTVRAVQRLGGAWRMGTSRVFFHIRVGARARLAVRRGHRQNYDISLMSAVGYLPATLVEAMELEPFREGSAVSWDATVFKMRCIVLGADTLASSCRERTMFFSRVLSNSCWLCCQSIPSGRYPTNPFESRFFFWVSIVPGLSCTMYQLIGSSPHVVLLFLV